MVCKHLLLPALAMGLAFYAPETSARNVPLLNSAQPNQQHLCFVENKGQIVNQNQRQRPDIDFRLSAGNGLNIFIGSGEIHYQWAKPIEASGHGKLSRTAGHELGASAKDMDAAPAYEMYRMDVSLIGANPNVTVITAGQQNFYERYYLPFAGANGAIAHAFHKITYKNVYPNIDWVLYIKANTVEYDFVVRRGGKVSDIKLKYGGTTTLKVNSGNLAATTPLGSITEKAPYSFHEDGKAISSKFILEDNILSFDVAEYSGTLTIDPVLEWGTYFGGVDDEAADKLAADQYGNVYMTGTTGSTSNIVTTGAFQTTYGGGSNTNGADAFLSKWSNDGNLLWATYYGGTSVDVAKGVSCDTSGNVYMGGYTKSTTGIATTGSYQSIKAGSAGRYDAFIVKFDSTGQRIWGTYFGGTQNEASTSMGLVCDKLGHIYFTGNTQSTSGIATAGAYQTTSGGFIDAFLAQFDINGQLEWATYYGGNDEDDPFGVTTDTSGNIYVTGYTLSSTGIATAAAYQGTSAGGQDAFIAKFDTSGQLQWGTYYGGNGIDRGYAITSQAGKIYIAGITSSSAGIATTGSFQDTIADNIYGDAFLAAFDGSGSLLWGTYYGGYYAETLSDLYAGSEGDVYISGSTNSTSGITTPNSYQPAFAGVYDLFVIKFNGLGQRQWGTYYGGADADSYGYLTGDDNSNIYLAGRTYSGSGIATVGSYQASLNGGQDVFLAKFNDCLIPSVPDPISGDTVVCGRTVNQYFIPQDTEVASYVWVLPTGWIGASATDSIQVTNDGTSGMLRVVAISACGGASDTQLLHITVHPSPDPQIINNNNVLSTTQPFDTYQWILNGQDVSGANSSTYIPTEDGYYSVSVTNGQDCPGISDSLSVTGVNGIANIKDNQSFKIYPNPAKEYVVVAAPVKALCNLFSIDGRILKKNIALRKGENRISFDKLSSGLYWLKIEANNYIQVAKIVIR